MIVAAALVALTALAWSYVLWLAASMGGGMAGMRMIPSGLAAMVPERAPWTGVEAAYVLAMWAAMMIGMMTPSAAPMILIHARVGRQAAAQGKAFAATGWFVAGYLVTWSGFAGVARGR